jgi:ATP-dependent helicase/nuclease subunit A
VSMKQQPKPQGSTWTDDQWDAITLGGENMLVAAAAGSGKTAVLVERIIRRISDNIEPIDVDRLLVATFTKAAASEMKHRIREALEKELIRQPKSHHLRKQLALMGRASITTLHSFCLEVIQRNFSLIHLDPGFRIANETEAALLRQDLLEELLEEYYGQSDEENAFWRLVDSFSGERSDASLIQLIQKLYDVSRSHPWPELWLRQMALMFGLPEGTSSMGEPLAESFAEAAVAYESVDYSLWQKSLITDCRLELEGSADLIRQAQDIAAQPGGPAPYLTNLQDDLLVIESLLTSSTRTWERLYEAFQTADFSKLKPCKADEVDKELQEQVKELRNRAKENVSKMREELFGRTTEQFMEEIHRLAPILHTLIDVVLDFGRRYQGAKAVKGLIDFADLEHFCLQILNSSEAPPGELIPSQAALEYRRQYVEILLDEYQDTNRVQESIVALISRVKPGNRFMVGDVKQSIYRFRLAEPGLFMEKYKAYISKDEADRANDQEGRRIDLARNFRSRTEVVDAVNFIFKQIMNETVGEIDYDSRAELVYGAGYPAPANDCSVEMVVIDRSADPATGSEVSENYDSDNVDTAEAEDDGSDGFDLASEAAELETAQLEARTIAQHIRKLMGLEGQEPPFEMYDKRSGGTRPVIFRDIVILLRATQQWAPVIIEELKLQGIPAYAELSTGYFSATEIEVMMSLLKVIDNPYQDIPLAAVLRSPAVGLSAEELAEVRVGGKNIAFYEAVKQIAAGIRVNNTSPGALQVAVNSSWNQALADKLQGFLHQLEDWRSAARQGSLADLIWRLYRETGYYDFVGGLPGGLQRQANLRALYDRARQYESTSLRGLFRFLRFLERMQDSGGDLGTARALGEQEDVVRIMSIHKSKGLEFPVVFVAGVAKMFNQRDLNDAFLIHKELGFGPKFVDTSLRISYPTLPSLAIKRRMKLELLAEEMRVLYVALTRAREKLVLIGTVRALDKLLRSWSRQLDNRHQTLPDYELARARCYLDWVGPALIRHPHAGLWREHIGLGGATGGRCLADPSSWSFTIIKPQELVRAAVEENQPLDDDRMTAVRSLQQVPTSKQWSEVVDARLSWKYEHPYASKLFAKTTVSEIKRLAEQGRVVQEPELPASNLWDPLDAVASLTEKMTSSSSSSSFSRSNLRRPRFMEEKKLTSAEKGTVMHAVMQNLPLQEPMTKETINETVARMLERSLMTLAQSEVVDAGAILSFFATDIGQRMLRAASVKREVPFSYGLLAGEVYDQTEASTAGETILIQGVIDCLFEDEQGLVLVDYKTDSLNGVSTEEMLSRYKVQIGLYSRAVEHIWKRTIAGKYIYYFDGARLIRM